MFHPDKLVRAATWYRNTTLTDTTCFYKGSNFGLVSRIGQICWRNDFLFFWSEGGEVTFLSTCCVKEWGWARSSKCSIIWLLVWCLGYEPVSEPWNHISIPSVESEYLTLLQSKDRLLCRHEDKAATYEQCPFFQPCIYYLLGIVSATPVLPGNQWWRSACPWFLSLSRVLFLNPLHFILLVFVSRCLIFVSICCFSKASVFVFMEFLKRDKKLTSWIQSIIWNKMGSKLILW